LNRRLGKTWAIVYWVHILNVFYIRRARRDSAEKTSKNGLNMNQPHVIKIDVQLFYFYQY